MELLCRPPSDAETVDWDSRPFERSALVKALSSTVEAQRVGQIRSLYVDLLRRDATAADCDEVRDWVNRRLGVDEVTRELAALPEARRVSNVRQIFIDRSGWDPRGWDDPGLRRWVDSPFTLAEIRSRLASQRPLVGVHYFAWYRIDQGGGATTRRPLRRTHRSRRSAGTTRVTPMSSRRRSGKSRMPVSTSRLFTSLPGRRGRGPTRARFSTACPDSG